MSALTTPVPAATDIGEMIGAKLYGRSTLHDPAGNDAMGLATTTPGANTLLGRLKAIGDAVDGLEGFAATLNGLVDGLEGLAVAPTPAGENFIGKTGGDVIIVPVTPTVSTTAYATGDVIGGIMNFAGVVRNAAGSSILQALSVFSKSGQTAAMDLLLFSASPSASTATDNLPWVLHANDFDKFLGVVEITAWKSLGVPSVAQIINIGLPIKPAASAAFGVLVARSTPTLPTTSDIIASLRVIPG